MSKDPVLQTRHMRGIHVEDDPLCLTWSEIPTTTKNKTKRDDGACKRVVSLFLDVTDGSKEGVTLLDVLSGGTSLSVSIDSFHHSFSNPCLPFTHFKDDKLKEEGGKTF
jgi:hypothetical protein